MGLRLWCVAAAVAASVCAAAAWQASADFADADGFTGRAGVDCTSCHARPHPTDDDAVAVLEGLPVTWVAGERHLLTVRVEGGPPAMPAPQPQGGFELETDTGTLHAGPGSEHLLRNPRPHSITYRPEGTLMREWRVEWQAPGLESPPRDARFWLAVLAANGNHVIATNTSDGGETFDSVATLQVLVPVDPATALAWTELPLTAPSVAVEHRGAGILVHGRHVDANATALAWHTGDGTWRARETGPAWRLELGSAPSVLHVRSEGAGRHSPDVVVTADDTVQADPPCVATPAGCGPSKTTPPAAAPTLLALLLLLLIPWRRPRCMPPP